MGLFGDPLAGMKGVDLPVIVGQRAQRVPEMADPEVVGMFAAVVAAPAAVGGQPRPPRRHIDQARGDHHRDEGHRRVQEQGLEGLRGRPGGAPRADVVDDRHDAHRRQHVHCVPFGADRQAEHQPCRPAPGPTTAAVRNRPADPSGRSPADSRRVCAGTSHGRRPCRPPPSR
ncbi:hypothetical protein SDC9_121882 [bioreactor metagenome]|uniref:Uncharacterized protein n=1 Tax=bioreactor metagenome TaxID=1076179 RepID=A0A645CDA8_9ZZZZ